MNTSHERVEETSVEWYTPSHVLEALGATSELVKPKRPPFDIDPCAAPARYRNRLPEIASQHLCVHDQFSSQGDGLTNDWGPDSKSVWLNPPYGREMDRWLKKMSEHSNGVALIFARTDTKAFQEYIW